jgi:DNA replication protein DnaC
LDDQACCPVATDSRVFRQRIARRTESGHAADLGAACDCFRIVGRVDLLVIDDWAMAPLSEPERRDFWEICEDRYQMRSTILTSQLPVSRWHEQIGDPTLADGILDRLVHNAHRIEMRGDSMRKNRGKPNA